MQKSNLTTAKGIILGVYPQGEHGRRLVLLTDRLGKITAFAGSAAKASSRLIGALRPLTAASFTMARGRSAWNIHEADIIDAFTLLPSDIEAYAYASYILEITEYLSFEGMEEREARFLLNLVYVTLDALRDNMFPAEAPSGEYGRIEEKTKLSAGTICSVFKLKILKMQGEYTEHAGYRPLPGKTGMELAAKTDRLWTCILFSPLTGMYRLAAGADLSTRECFSECVDVLFKKQVPHTFRSLLILQQSGI